MLVANFFSSIIQEIQIIMIIVSNICFSCVSDTILSALKILTHFYIKAILSLPLLVYRKGNRGTERLSGMPHAGIWAMAVRVQGPHLLTTTMLLLLWRKRQRRTFLRHSYKILRQIALPPAKTSTVRWIRLLYVVLWFKCFQLFLKMISVFFYE